jgi:hypothetical protein
VSITTRTSRALRRRRADRRARSEIEAAVELVASGAARSVRLAGLPAAARVAAPAIRRAHQAGVHGRVERAPGAGIVLRFDAARDR